MTLPDRAALGTMHGKAAAIAPPLARLGITLVVPEGLDNDRFGTFTAEVPREGTMEYAARAKARSAIAATGSSVGIASEGAYTHVDAEVIAATVAGMPDRLDGIRMAISVAELARAGMTPDRMPGVVPRCVSLETKQNQHGERSSTIIGGIERVRTRGKWRTVEVLACPVTWRSHPEQIASARSGYEDW